MPPSKPAPRGAPDYVTDPTVRAEIERRQADAAVNTVVEPILSFDNDLLPPDGIAADFDAGTSFAATRIYEGALAIRNDVAQMSTPPWMDPHELASMSTELLARTIAESAYDFRNNSREDPYEILPNLVGYVILTVYQKLVVEHEAITTIGGAT